MSTMRSLREFVRKDRPERCELCSTELPPAHQHLINPGSRQLICSCDGCSVLFDASGATKWRRIPRNVRWLEGFELPDDDWQRLGVPIRLGFIYKSSRARQVIAAYPSPAGVTESPLDEEPWRRIAGAHSELAGLRDDVEALLVNRLDEKREYFVAPIDRCFELVGIVRSHWKGLSGGDRVWDEVRRFLSTLKEGAAA